MSITKGELANFNKFYAALSPEDQQVLDQIAEHAAERNPMVDLVRGYMPYHAWLLSLLVETHKELIRLRDQLEVLKQ